MSSPKDTERHEEHHHLSLIRDGRDPTLPSNHPINALSSTRKLAILCVLTYSGFLANFSVAIIQVAFPNIGGAFGVSPAKIPNTIGYNLLGFAVGPLLWNPLSRTVGRRTVYLIGSTLFIPCAVWMALSPYYGVFCAARVVAGFISSWSQTVPPSTIADIFVKEVRGSKMSMFAVGVVIAPPVAPIFCGLVVTYHTWPVLFWIVTGMAGLQLALFFLVVPETLWVEDEYPLQAESLPPTSNHSGSNIEGEIETKAHGQHVEHSPVRATSAIKSGHTGMAWYPWQRPGEFLKIFVSPITMLRFISITVPSIYYGSVFAWSVGITIVFPQKFEAAPYSIKTIPLGAMFLAFGVGGLLGKWSGGIVGDKTVSYFERRKGYRQPEHRLWALIPILPFMFVGCILCGVTVDHKLPYMVYLFGGALFFFCLSAATGLLQTYVLEGYISKSMDTQAVFVFWKSIWGFAVAFFVYDWGLNSSFTEEYATQGALATGVGAIICAVFIAKGYEIRKWQGMPVTPKD